MKYIVLMIIGAISAIVGRIILNKINKKEQSDEIFSYRRFYYYFLDDFLSRILELNSMLKHLFSPVSIMVPGIF